MAALPRWLPLPHACIAAYLHSSVRPLPTLDFHHPSSCCKPLCLRFYISSQGHLPSHPCVLQVVDSAAPIASLAIGLTSLAFAWEAWESVHGLKDGFSPMPYGFFGALMLLVAALDLKYRLVANTTIASRRYRHIWRMSFALFVAAGSLFTGPGAAAFPAWLQASGLLSVPEPLILLTMVYWLIRLRLLSRRSPTTPERGT